MTTESASWRRSPLRRAELAAIAGVGYPLLRALGTTLRWRVSGAEHVEAIRAAGLRPILAFWHGRILPATLYFQRQGIVAVTSESFDGEWISRIIHRFGYGTARGSTSQGGPRALRQLVREATAGGAAFTLDGPRGPARVAQPGAVWLARATGNPLLPFHSEATPCWTAGSWDRLQVPKPRALVTMAIGAPLYVPGDGDDWALEASRLALERSLAMCEDTCRQLLSAPPCP